MGASIVRNVSAETPASGAPCFLSRRFRDELHEEYPELPPAWYAFRDIRAKRRAAQWLAGNSLIDDDSPT
jgi:hypothetical protein